MKARLAELEISYSLNPWITAGHADRGRNDLERLPGLECVVGHDGIVPVSCRRYGGNISARSGGSTPKPVRR